MAELKTATAKIEAEMAADDLANQIATLRADLAKLSESVAALGHGAKAAAAEEANLLMERARDKVRVEPLFTLVATAGIAYMLGVLSRR